MSKRALAAVVVMAVGLLAPHDAAANAEGDQAVASMDLALAKVNLPSVNGGASQKPHGC